MEVSFLRRLHCCSQEQGGCDEQRDPPHNYLSDGAFRLSPFVTDSRIYYQSQNQAERVGPNNAFPAIAVTYNLSKALKPACSK
jgi:hypothetical protein